MGCSILSHIEIVLINHLKVNESDAQSAKLLLEKLGALNIDFLPINKEGYIFWPLNFEVEGEVVSMEGKPSTKVSRDYRANLPDYLRVVAPRAFDIFGDIAIIKLPHELEPHFKAISDSIVNSNTNISKVAIDLGVKGDYRVRKLKMIHGEDNFVATHKENGLTFVLDISKVYFSPRLSMERNRLSKLVSSGENVLDAFAGAAPFSVTLAKQGAFVKSIDANPEAENWAIHNYKLNNISEQNYSFHCSDVENYNFGSERFDRVIMNNPTNSLFYLPLLSDLVKLDGFIHIYHIDSKEEDFDIVNMLGDSFICTKVRKVHPYSPSAHLKVFDIKRTKH